jgi:SSS family solute:Na+ symporter
MTTAYVIGILSAYFGLLYIVSRLSTRSSDDSTFFIANRNAPWPLVAYGMIGVGISGITYISVPGQVVDTQFSYFQLVIGYAIGLLIVAFVLVPLFYRLRLVSIYQYLSIRFGKITQKSGAVLFILAQLINASFRLYLMAYVLQLVLFQPLGIPFGITVFITLILIWFYTYRGGIKTVILTDTLQTTFLLLAVVLSIIVIGKQLDMSVADLYQGIKSDGISQTFFWSFDNPNNFFKLVFTGTLLVVMTNGLDQSIMQKHLTCKDLRSSQRNLISLAVGLLIANLLFLFLGGVLYIYATGKGINLPAQTDNIYPVLAINHFGMLAGTFFLVGIAAAAYSSADSSLTGLTTSFCIDILDQQDKDIGIKRRYLIHFGFSVIIFLVIMIYKSFHNTSVLYAFIRTSGFVYGPLVGLFAFGMFARREVSDRWIPFVCVASPVLSGILDANSEKWFNGYDFGYEILIINSIIAFAGLLILSRKSSNIGKL